MLFFAFLYFFKNYIKHLAIVTGKERALLRSISSMSSFLLPWLTLKASFSV